MNSNNKYYNHFCKDKFRQTTVFQASWEVSILYYTLHKMSLVQYFLPGKLTSIITILTFVITAWILDDMCVKKDALAPDWSG